MFEPQCYSKQVGGCCPACSAGQCPSAPPEETEKCPKHGKQRVLRHSATKGNDPYDVSHLACGHKVVAFGPDEQDIYLYGSHGRA